VTLELGEELSNVMKKLRLKDVLERESMKEDTVTMDPNSQSSNTWTLKK